MKLTFTLNGQMVEAEPGQTVMDAATAAGIPIPSICHHRNLIPEGSCRLCSVEVEGRRGEIASCTLPVVEGMVARSETPAIKETRLQVLGLLLRDYHDAGYNPDDPETEFMYWVRRSGLPMPPPREPRYPINSDPNPFIWVDMNKCIQCSRCVRACEEVQGRFVLGVAGRGRDRHIVAGAGTTMLDARCESCGACVAHCPTGALDNKMSVGLDKPDRIVTTTCGYCGVGCRFDMHVKNRRILRVVSNPHAAVNGMELCVKGRYGYDFVHHPDRLKTPRVRKYLLEGAPRPKGRGDWVDTDWDTALDLVAATLVRIKRESGADAIGVLSSAKCTNEENYLAQKFARQVIGTHNVDHCARLCHASTVAGLAMSYGSGAMSNTFDDICSDAKAMLIIGSNTTEQHPVFGARIRQAVLKRGVKLVVADPRRIDISEFATLHLRHRPGTDVALINGLMHIMLKNGWQDQAFIDGRCEGFEEFKATIGAYTPESVARTTVIPVEELYEAAELLALNKPMAVIWAMGITQHTTGVPNVLSLGNLQMLLGNMGVPGGGVNPLRGQNNVQGACDMGALPNVFPGYQNVTDAAVRAKFSTAWLLEGDGASGPLFGDAPGMTSTEMVHELRGGKLRAMYIIGEDPLMTDPDLNDVRECFEACEFTVLQEIFPSETAGYADVLLPAASFIETDGSFTNTERRIQRVHAALNPVGDSRSDWQALSDVAKRMLAIDGRHAAGPHAGWEYASPASVMDEIAALTPSYAGVSFARLDRGEQLLWPVKGPDHPGTPILHVGQFTRGKGKFHAIDHLPPEELPDAEYPILLTTGRVLYHWHGGEMTRRANGLLEIYPESLVEINPEDALKTGLDGSGAVTVTSRRGQMTARVLVTDRVSPGIIFANFHFPGDQNVNNVTICALDPVARIPEYKVCAVKIAPADWRPPRDPRGQV
jgi:formate dehydrogenase alpha subunit